jgi:3-oxoadipate enol-lactonase
VTVNRISYGTGTIALLERLDAENPIPLVFLHAFPLNATMWKPQLEALADRYRLVAVDLRGFGKSEPFDGIATMETYAADVLAVLDARGFERVVLVGLSMGGYVALTFARHYGDRLAGLVLADTRAGADTVDARKGRFEMIELARKSGASAVAEKMLSKLLSERARSANPDLVESVRSMIEATPTSTITAALEAMANRADSSQFLGTIAVPVLVVVGSDDEVTPRAEAEQMAASIAGARFEVIDGAGHLSNLERPEAFSSALETFLGSL